MINSSLKAAAIALAATFGSVAASEAATVASTTVSSNHFGGITADIATSGTYNLVFSGGNSYAAYALADPSGSWASILSSLSANVFSTHGATTIALGHLVAGADFVTALFAYGHPVTVSLNLVAADLPAVPLPATLPMLIAALAGAGAFARARKKAA